jgi:hypothetical protein
MAEMHSHEDTKTRRQHEEGLLTSCFLRVFVSSWFVGAAAGQSGAPTKTHVEGHRIDFRIGDSLAASYHIASSQVKPYLWPIVTPKGVRVTRDWPMTPKPVGGTDDHVHQRSAWFTFGDVIPEGIAVPNRKPGIEGVNFWEETPVQGRIACVSMCPPVGDCIATCNEWRMTDGTVILTESRTISFHDLGVGRLIDVQIVLCATNVAIVFGDTKEGAFGIRVHDQLRTDMGKGKAVPPANKMTDSKGREGEKEIWGRLADWCDMSGEIDGQLAGVAVFDHPSNSHRACWHARAYGLLAANPFGRERSKFPDMAGRQDRVRIEKGEQLRLRYGIYVHDGDVKSGRVAQAYAEFAKLGRQ